MTYEIKRNQTYNSFEIYFDGKPDEFVRNALKGMRFRWNRVKQCWYGFAPDETTIHDRITGKKAAPHNGKSEPKNKLGVKVGDVFYESWGYEQTNIDFWQVVDLKGTSQIVLKAISGKSVKDVAPMQSKVVPVKDGWTKHYTGNDQITKIVKGTPEHVYCHSEHGNIYKTDWETEHLETSYY